MIRPLLSLLFLFPSLATFAQQPLTIWYRQPARNWNEALPVGNGRLGAMVFGRGSDERIQLNEATLWSGGPVNPNPTPNAASYLPQVREALFREDYKGAANLLKNIHALQLFCYYIVYVSYGI